MTRSPATSGMPVVEQKGSDSLRSTVRAPGPTGHLIHLSDHVGVYPGPKNSLDHSEVLKVVVRLEEGISGEELDQNAPYAPDVAWIGPAQSKDDLGCPVVTSGDDGRVILILERRRAEVDQPDLRVEEHLPRPRRLPRRGDLRGGNAFVVGVGLIARVAEQDVFRLQVCVD